MNKTQRFPLRFERLIHQENIVTMNNGIGQPQALRAGMKIARSLGLRGENARPHLLILTAPLLSDTDSYNLSLEHSDQSKVLPWAEGLRDRNGFVGVAHALGIAKVPVRGGIEYPSAAQIAFHNDQALFPTAATNVLAEWEQLGSLYMGRHSLVTNDKVRIDKNPNYGLLTRNTTQHSATTVNEQIGDQFKEIGAPVRFAGGDTNSIDFYVPCKDKSLIGGTVTGGNGHKNYLVYFLAGAIIKGGTTKVYTK
ncbi:MAG: hypothetical protein AAGJ82_07430 [Bacteroidota bacterium]